MTELTFPGYTAVHLSWGVGKYEVGGLCFQVHNASVVGLRVECLFSISFCGNFCEWVTVDCIKLEESCQLKGLSYNQFSAFSVYWFSLLECYIIENQFEVLLRVCDLYNLCWSVDINWGIEDIAVHSVCHSNLGLPQIVLKVYNLGRICSQILEVLLQASDLYNCWSVNTNWSSQFLRFFQQTAFVLSQQPVSVLLKVYQSVASP